MQYYKIYDINIITKEVLKMTLITEELVKCKKCGKESYQDVICSVSYSYDKNKLNNFLSNFKQKCPYCNYEDYSIASPDEINLGKIFEDKELIYKIVNKNFSIMDKKTWASKTWYIYDNLTVNYEIIDNEGNKRKKYYLINKNDLNIINENIKLVESEDLTVESYDGDAWEFIRYENNKAIWKRALGYTYGINSLENIEEILRELVSSDSNLLD